MQPIVVTVGPLASASANNIAQSQTPSGAANLTLNGSTVTGGVAVLDTARQVLITTTANESSKTFIISGTSWAGDAISESVTGPNNSTATSVLSYKTVTSVYISAAAAGALTVGTTTTASSPWVRLDSWAAGTVAKQCTASGTVNFTVQQTMDDPNSPTNPVVPSAVTWVNDSDMSFVGATGNVQGFYAYVPLWVRVNLNSGTGSVTLTLGQAGSVTY